MLWLGALLGAVFAARISVSVAIKLLQAWNEIMHELAMTEAVMPCKSGCRSTIPESPQLQFNAWPACS